MPFIDDSNRNGNLVCGSGATSRFLILFVHVLQEADEQLCPDSPLDRYMT
jgi:hypothetical protein